MGPLRYTRKVLTVRAAKGRLLGGLILQSYFRERYVEKFGFHRFGGMSGSPQGESRHFYVKRLSGRHPAGIREE